MSCILVLVRPRPAAPPPPESWPVGCAALSLAAQGIPLRFGDLRPVPGGWAPCESTPRALYDRFPSWTHPMEHAALLRPWSTLPLANSTKVQALCRDKLATQARLEAAGVPIPPVSADPSQALLREWGGGFLKPRYGGLGRGVRYVRPGDPLPPTLPGATGHPEPAILQRPVLPRRGVPTYVSLRVLVQRDIDGGWVCGPVVARVSEEPVSNVDRGAVARPAIDLLSPSAIAAAVEVSVAAAQALSDDWTAELGVDVILDARSAPWVIEVNGVPKGRGAELARRHPQRFGAAYQACLERPLRWLWSVSG